MGDISSTQPSADDACDAQSVDDVLEFAASMKRAGLMGELLPKDIERWAEQSGPWLDCLLAGLESYYALTPDAETGERRRRADRCVVIRQHPGICVAQILDVLVRTAPELQGTKLETIGSDVLVLRQHETRVVIEDECSDADAQGEETALASRTPSANHVPGSATLSVRALVQSANALLSNLEVERRWVPLVGESHREPYVAVDRPGAMELLESGFLDLERLTDVVDFGRWNVA